MRQLARLINSAFREKRFSFRISTFSDYYDPEKFEKYYFNDHLDPIIYIRDSDNSIKLERWEENKDGCSITKLNAHNSDFLPKLFEFLLQCPNIKKHIEEDIRNQ